jgi:hypothetical protein
MASPILLGFFLFAIVNFLESASFDGFGDFLRGRVKPVRTELPQLFQFDRTDILPLVLGERIEEHGTLLL